MKKIFLDITIVISIMLMIISLFISCATMSGTDLTSEQARIIDVIDCPGINKDDLFILANSWAVDVFVSAESVIEFSDKEAGIVKGKYIINFVEGVYVQAVRSTLTIEVKDDAARITIADPYYRTVSGLGETYAVTEYYPMRSAESFKKNCMPKYLNLIASFKKAIQEIDKDF